MKPSERPTVGVPQTALAPHALARWAKKRPSQVAVRHAEGEQLTYSQLDVLARRWANALEGLGVERGTRVATLLPNGFDAQLLWLGLGWLGAIEVPLNTGLVGDLLRHALDASESAILVTSCELVERLRDLEGELPALERILLVDGGRSGVDLALRRPVVDLKSLVERASAGSYPGPRYRDIHALLFTSGTTGPSKPVIIPWAMVHQNWSWAPEDAIAPGEFTYCAMPLFHNSGRSALNGCLVRGGSFVFREKFSGTSFWDDVRRHDCRVASLVGPMTAFLDAQPPRDDDADNPLRGILCGPLIRGIEEFEKRFRLRVGTGYGQTETGMALVTGWDHGPWKNCGRRREDYPWPEVRVVDENDEPLGPGEVGELVVRSREPWSLNVGYYGMPEATVEAWRHGWFHTGDAFRYDEEGWFYLVDRMKDAIRRRGENISSFEVESLVAAHPDVVECAAVAAPAELGEDEVRVVLTVRDARSFDPEALIDWLESRIPRHMQPRYVDVVNELPRNETTGRIKKHEIRDSGVGPDTWDRERRSSSEAGASPS